VKSNARGNLGDRTNEANGVLAAWKTLDETLTNDLTVQGSTAPVAAFFLNDAVYSRAKYYSLNSRQQGVAPRLEAIPVEERVRLTPPRVCWAHRYLDGLEKGTSTVVLSEEAARFRSMEA